jgi:hypothetical protein
MKRLTLLAVISAVVDADATSLIIRDRLGIQQIDRRDVHTVGMAEGTDSPTGAIVGAAIGALVGFLITTNFDVRDGGCGSSFETLTGGLAVGFGFAGYKMFRHEPKLVYFRARP